MKIVNPNAQQKRIHWKMNSPWSTPLNKFFSFFFGQL
jgi:hypothetical protein